MVFWGTVGSHVVFLCSRVLGEGAGSDFGCLGDPPGKDLGKNLGDSLPRSGRSWRPSFVPTSSQVWPNFRSVGVPPSILPLTRPALQLKGRRSRGAL